MTLVGQGTVFFAMMDQDLKVMSWAKQLQTFKENDDDYDQWKKSILSTWILMYNFN